MMRYEMNKSMERVDRAVYGALDLLGDVGGFNEALSWMTALIMLLLQYQTMNRFMVARLYKHRDDNPNTL